MAVISRTSDSTSRHELRADRQPINALDMIFAASLVFQLTVLATTLQVSIVGRLVNAAILIFFIGLAAANSGAKASAIFKYYQLPIALILLGFLINLLRSVGQSSIGYFSILLPWLAAASVPFNRTYNFDRAWRIYFWFMLIVAIDGLIEYVLVFEDILPTRRADLVQGDFLVGMFSVFHELQGVYFPHERLYGVFLEPGTAAMFALPALGFSLVYRHYIAAGIFLVFIYLTGSLGGYAAGALLIAIFLLWRINAFIRLWRLLGLALVVIVPLVIYPATHYLISAYEAKGGSAETRETNVSAFITNFGTSIVQSPMGMGLKGHTLTDLDSSNAYFGSNFSVYVAFVEGGVLALVGYVALLAVSAYVTTAFLFTYRGGRSAELCAFIALPSMLSFVFQRATILECVVFAFLFAPAVVARLVCARIPAEVVGPGLVGSQNRKGNNE